MKLNLISSFSQLHDRGTLKKSNSCSTIFVDESTVCQPNLKNTIKCVTLAIYYHIKNRQSDRQMDIFDEKLHPLSVCLWIFNTVYYWFKLIDKLIVLSFKPLQKDGVSNDYSRYNPDHRQVYKFVRTLFNAAQLTAECAIITLIYLERYWIFILIYWLMSALAFDYTLYFYFLSFSLFLSANQITDLCRNWHYSSQLEKSGAGCHSFSFQSLGRSSRLECWLLPNSQGYHGWRYVSFMSYLSQLLTFQTDVDDWTGTNWSATF